MSLQPQHVNPAPWPVPPAGWYQDPADPSSLTWRYWDGYRWTEHASFCGPGTLARYSNQPALTPYAPPATHPRHVSGLTTGGHLVHAVLTVCTLGLWAPVWALVAWLGRRRVS